MNQPLLLLLMTLTLLDLGFVQATDVVPTAELLPLWLLAAGTRWLRRLQRHKLYHAGWNIGVVAVFTLLVHHATTSGLLHMLEDGLVLAVLCQVHLWRNQWDQAAEFAEEVMRLSPPAETKARVTPRACRTAIPRSTA